MIIHSSNSINVTSILRRGGPAWCAGPGGDFEGACQGLEQGYHELHHDMGMDQYLLNTIFNGMNIHLPAILMFTKGTWFWHTAICGRAKG